MASGCISRTFRQLARSRKGSTKVEVDAYVLNPSRDKGGYCITVQDDGVGMDRSSLNNMLSFGFSDKEHVSGNAGRFGIGFKSGSML